MQYYWQLMSLEIFLDEAAREFERSDWSVAYRTAEVLRRASSPSVQDRNAPALSHGENTIAPPRDLEVLLNEVLLNKVLLNKVLLNKESIDRTSCAASILAVYRELTWFRSNRSQMAYSQVLGPGAILPHNEVRFGLFFLRPGSDYPNHVHGADEVYIVLAGSGEWSLEQGPYERKKAGDIIEVPSMTVHALRARDSAMLTLWSWTGDITLDRYRFTD
jgi:quercetin dioxygenase-like cupin family protein